MTSSHPDKDNPREAAVTSSADKATTQPKKEAPGERSPSPVEDATDDTEFKQTEELPHSEERFRLLVEGVQDYAIFMLDPEGRITSWNAGAERIKGYSAEEIVGRHFSSFYTDEDVERGHPEEELRLAEEQGRYEEEGWRVRKDGTRFWASVLITALRDGEEGNLRGFSKVVRDVTERRESEEALRESEEFFRALYEKVHHPIFLIDKELNFVDVNPYACEFYGYSQEEFKQMKVSDITIPEDLATQQENAEELRQHGETFIPERRLRKKNGEVVTVTADIATVTRAGQELYVGKITDITERKRAEERLRQAETRYRTLVERMPAVVYIQEIGSPDSAMYMSPQIETLTGYSPEECKDPDLRWHMVHPDDRERMQAEDEKTGEPGEVFTTEYRVLHRDGRTVWVHNESVMVEEEKAGGSRYWQGFIVDITERKALGERLHHQAYHDPLTQLPNRLLFVDRLEQALRHTRRRPGIKVAVLLMDLDNFKVVNDSLGHELGDRLLVAVGERFGEYLRPEDTLARFGGDEFTVLIEDIENPEDAVRAAERITEALRGPFVLEGRELFVTSSIGIALGEARTKSPEVLLRDADTAMYRAKEEGLQYQIFDPAMYGQALSRLRLENELRRAIEAEEFVVHYHPIVDLQTEEVRSMEALVRWRHPRRGLLDPEEFVASAEESGLLVPMGKWVLKGACEQAKEWQERHPHMPALVIAVNLSARQLHRPDLVRTVEEVLRETGLEARCLSLDITETLYIKALEGNTAALDKLKKMGVSISIDDFGVGYSSLAYLKRLPADALKIDRVFIAGLGEHVEDTAIVQMIIELAHTFGMEVIAEGVESEVQAEQLKEMGCDLAQGFYFSEPLPPQAASEFLAR